MPGAAAVTEEIQRKAAGARVSLGELYLNMNYFGRIYAPVPGASMGGCPQG